MNTTTYIVVPDRFGYWKVVSTSDGSAEMTALEKGCAMRLAAELNQKTVSK